MNTKVILAFLFFSFIINFNSYGDKRWEFSSSEEGWYGDNSVARQTNDNGPSGQLNVNIYASDSRVVIKNPNIDASSLKTIKFRIATYCDDKKIELFFKLNNLNDWKHGPSMILNNHREYQEHTLDLRNIADWKPNVTEIRLDPTKSSTGFVAFDWIELNDNGIPEILGSPAPDRTDIKVTESIIISVQAKDPNDIIKLYYISERIDGSNHFEEEIDHHNYLGNHIHQYRERYQYNTTGKWRWKIYAIDQTGQKGYYPTNNYWSNDIILVSANNQPPTIVNEPSPDKTEVKDGEKVRFMVQAKDPGDEIEVFLETEKTDGSGYFSKEINWEKHIEDDTHQYSEEISFPSTGDWQWKIYAEDQSGLKSYYPISGDWSSTLIKVIYNDPAIQLKFPIKNYSPSSINITAILDHSNVYNTKGPESKPIFPMINFLGEKAGTNCKLVERKYFGWYKDHNYGLWVAKSNNKSNLLPNYNYNDNIFWYFGHAGYDYATTGNIYAVAPGKVFYPSKPSQIGWSNEQPEEYHVLAIDHRNGEETGYISFYFHLRNTPNPTDPFDLNVVVNDGDEITKEMVDSYFAIGKAGNYQYGVARNKDGIPKNIHLHYELHWINSNSKHIIVDPYGWHPNKQGDNDPLIVPSEDNKGHFNTINGGDDRPDTDKKAWLWADPMPTSENFIKQSPTTSEHSVFSPTIKDINDWTIIQPVPENLNDVDFPTEKRGYVCGDLGVILKTDNYGQTWDNCTKLTKHSLRSTSFGSENVGVVVGKNTILRTTDGGEHWTRHWVNNNTIDTNEVSIFFTEVKFTSSNIAYLAGFCLSEFRIFPVIYKSTDAGSTWNPIANFVTGGNYNEKYIGAMHFINDNLGYISTHTVLYPANPGWVTTRQNIYKTSNGGDSWSEKTVDGSINNFVFTNSSTGFAFGLDKSFKTNDATATNPSWLEFDPANNAIFDVDIADGSIISVGYGGNVQKSVDGTNWTPIDVGTTEDLHAVSVKSRKRCFVGSNGTIVVSKTQSQYTITATAYNSGSISPSGDVTVNFGDNITFNIEPITGYNVDSVVVDGIHVGSMSSYTFENVSANHTILAFFAKKLYTITASAAAGGTIIPSGEIIVPYHEDTEFRIKPDDGYNISSVLVDGINVGTNVVYQFRTVTENHTIHAEFNKYNRPPVLNIYEQIFDTSADVNFDYTLTFDLVPIFTDPDGDPLSYSVNSSDLQCVNAVISDNKLLLTSKLDAIGSDKVIVTASDGTFSVIDDFTIYITWCTVSNFRINNQDVNNGFQLWRTNKPDTINYDFYMWIYNLTNKNYCVALIDEQSNIVKKLADNLSESKFEYNGFFVDDSYQDGKYCFAVLPANATTIEIIGYNSDTVTISDKPSIDLHVDRNKYIAGANTYIDTIIVSWTITDGVENYLDGNIRLDLFQNDIDLQYTFDNPSMTAGQCKIPVPSRHLGSDFKIKGYNLKYSKKKVFDFSESFEIVLGHKITMNMISGGTVIQSRNVAVESGADSTIKIDYIENYEVDSVVVDGKNEGIIDDYAFINISDEHTINVYLSAVPILVVSITSSSNGTTNPTGEISPKAGDTIKVISNPINGYHLAEWEVSDSITAIEMGDTGKFIVSGNGAINAVFEANEYKVIVSSTVGGLVDPVGEIMVKYGDTLKITATPTLTGYSFSNWSVTGDVVIVDTYINGSFLINGNGTIEAAFAAMYRISAIAYAGGTMSPSGNTYVSENESIQYKILPKVDYQIDSVLVDNTNMGDISEYTFLNVNSTHIIVAYFSENLIRNGKFNDSLDFWGTEIDANCKADFDFSMEQCSVYISELNIANTSEIYKIQLKQPITSLKPATFYRLSFSCKGTIPKIAVNAIKDSDPWTYIGLWKKMNITNAWNEYTIDFKTSDVIFETNRICILLASGAGTFIVDNIRLFERKTGVFFTKTTDQIIAEDSSATLTLNMTDAQELEYIPLTLLVGSGSNYTTTGKRVTPIADFNGKLTVPIKVTNGVDTTGTIDMTITVTPVNDAPLAIDPPTQNIEVDKLWQFQLSANDVDGDNLTWNAIPPVPNGFSISTTGIISWTPDSSALGNHLIKVLVSDNDLYDTAIVNIMVENPVIIITDPQNNQIGTKFDAYHDENKNKVILLCRDIGRQEVIVKIFDPLANILWEDKVFIHSYEKNKWKEFTSWDLKNKYGRTVSGLTVLIIFKSENEGKITIQKKLLGIRTKR